MEHSSTHAEIGRLEVYMFTPGRKLIEFIDTNVNNISKWSDCNLNDEDFIAGFCNLLIKFYDLYVHKIPNYKFIFSSLLLWVSFDYKTSVVFVFTEAI